MPSVVLYALVSGTVETVPDPDKVSPGFAGFAVVFLLAIATIVLIRSMTRHLRKANFGTDPSDPADLGQVGDHGQSTGDVVDDQRVHPGRE